MRYYAQLNDKDVVAGISDLGEEAQGDKLISIDSFDVSLFGCKYNRENAEFLPKFQISADKNKIKPDGQDTTIITVNVGDTTYNGMLTFMIDNEFYTVIAKDGQATFQFASEDAKKYTITVITENWGNNSIDVEVV